MDVRWGSSLTALEKEELKELISSFEERKLGKKLTISVGKIRSEQFLVCRSDEQVQAFLRVNTLSPPYSNAAFLDYFSSDNNSYLTPLLAYYVNHDQSRDIIMVRVYGEQKQYVTDALRQYDCSLVKIDNIAGVSLDLFDRDQIHQQATTIRSDLDDKYSITIIPASQIFTTDLIPIPHYLELYQEIEDDTPWMHLPVGMPEITESLLHKKYTATDPETIVGIVLDTNGIPIALSELRFKEDIPNVCYHGNTGVARAHRGNNLAYKLKICLLDYLLSDRQEIVLWRTTNTVTNQTMISINERLLHTLLCRKYTYLANQLPVTMNH